MPNSIPAELSFGPVVLGGNVFGWTVKRDAAFALLDAFVEAGGTSIDTADGYSVWVPGNVGGESETILGEWMALRKNRERVVLATKMGKWAAHPGLSPANVRRSIDDSLRRLRTDYVDLYYAHEDDPEVPQEEYMDAFDALVRQGKVRALGASNFTAERLASALAISRKNGLHSFRVSQDHYNLVDRGFETSLRPTLEREQLVELPYWSLASGFLTGKYRPGGHVESARAGGAGKYLEAPKNVALLGVLDEIAAAHGVSVAAIALAWLRAQPTVGAPIASARTVEQLAPLFEGARTKLSPDELAKLSLD